MDKDILLELSKLKFYKMDKRIDEINNLIAEEIGISREVAKITKEICDTIKIQLGEQSFIETGLPERFNDIKAKKVYFNYEMDKQRVSVSVLHYYMPNEQRFMDLLFYNPFIFECDSYRVDGDKNSSTMQGIRIKSCSINGKFSGKYFYGSIQHEISHIYEQHKANHEYSNGTQYRNFLTGMYSEDINERKFCQIMYMSDKGEIDSFANSLHGAFVNSDNTGITPTSDNIQQSVFYKRAKEIETYCKEFLSGEITNTQEICNKYQIKIKDFNHLCETLPNTLFKKIGRTIVKIQKDLLGERFTHHLGYPIFLV